jgi:hypothetical protein
MMDGWRLIESAWTLIIIVCVVLVMLALTGCAAPGACVKPIVTLTRPDLPTVPAADLQCLRDETYRALALRDVLLHQAVEECEAVVHELAEVPR